MPASTDPALAAVPFFAAPLGLRREERWAAAGETGLRFWSQSRCLVTTRAMARRAGFAEAAHASAARGWQVHVRESGGSTVAHDATVLCIGWAREVAGFDLVRGYEAFTGGLLAALAELGIDAATGPMPHAPCDGRFNVLVAGRKLAGTAMRLRPSAGGHHVLAHAALMLAPSPEAMAAVAAFERAGGLAPAYDPGAEISLAEVLPGDRRGAERLVAAIARAFVNR